MATIKFKWIGLIIPRDGIWNKVRNKHTEIGRRTLSNRETRFENALSVNSSNNKYQQVADFYAGKCVFLTGGTGFLGKVFIERLLYSCPQIDKIYLLVRQKENVTPEKRLEELFFSSLFDKLKKERPENFKKIIPIIGDVTLPNLGISSEDEQTLIDKVSVVIHSAATIKFNEPLSVAMKINVEGTQKIMELCRRMNKIENFLYVSTMYNNTDKRVLQEAVYPPPAKLGDVYKFLEVYGDDEELTKKFLDGQPNTYTYTKALAENYVMEHHGTVPTVIVKPSIVISAYNDPAGWLDNWSGITAIANVVANGVLRVVPGAYNHVTDVIPVDFTVNLCIAAAARCKGSEEVPVFNSCTSSTNPLLWGEFMDFFRQEYVRQKLNILPFPTLIFTKNKWLMTSLSFLLETTPAFFGDIWLRFLGEQPRYTKLLSKGKVVRQAVHPFMFNTWTMHSYNTRDLFASLSADDRKQFPFDPIVINWRKYIPKYIQGVKRYLKTAIK